MEQDPRRTALFASDGSGVKPDPGDTAPGADSPGVAPVERLPLAEDTPLEVEAVQFEMWRRLTPERKLLLVPATSVSAHETAFMGVSPASP